uniref:Protein phosphatase 1D n=1 Tax=Ascaris suum TaxID=6253 RepID=F1KRG3_ASCSU
MPLSECGDRDSPRNDPNAEVCGHNLRITVCATQGGRKYMEDRVQIECIRFDDGTIDYTYIAVYDGHGGSEASEYVRRHLLKNIQAQSGFNGDDEAMLEAIKNGFIETHLAMWKVVDEWPLTASGYTSTAGTTASCAFIRRGKLFTAHVGDSAIILGRLQGGCLIGNYLTVDHKPDSAMEEQRINGAGGMIMRKSGVMRVVWKRPIRGHIGPVRRSTPTESIAFLAVARALGDLWSYNQDTKQFIVSPEPDVSVLQLDANDKFLVLASDGLTNVLKAQQIADIVYSYECEGRDEDGFVPNHSRWLLHFALRGWGPLRADNISVVTVMLDDGKKGPFYEMAGDVVLSSDVNMNLEDAFTVEPSSMIHITSNQCQQLLTVPVELVYAGAVDFNFGTGVEYRGPGFSRHTRVAQATISDAAPRLVPVLPFRRVPSLSSISNLFSQVSNSQPTPTEPANRCVNIIGDHVTTVKEYERITDTVSVEVNGEKGRAAASHVVVVSRLQQIGSLESTDQRPTEHSATPSSVSRKRRLSFKSVEGSMNISTPSANSLSSVDPNTGKPVKYYCKKHGLVCASAKKRNEEYAANRMMESECRVVSDAKNESETTDDEQCAIASTCDQTTSATSLAAISEEHAYASSSAKSVTVLSSLTTTPSGRRRLVAIRRTPMYFRRRGQARRNLAESHLIGERERLEEEGDEDSAEEDASHDGLKLLISVPVPKLVSGEAAPKRSLGGASALSPALMLAALRTPDRIMHATMKDPISRDMSLYGLRSSRSRSLSDGHAPTLLSLNPLSITDDSPERETEDGDSADSRVLSSTQKRKFVEAQERNSQPGPPAKRSRFWGFFTNMLGGKSTSK